MKLQITGERGSEIKTVTVKVLAENPHGFTVRHTDGKPAFIGGNGSSYNRMRGSKYITLMKNCIVVTIPEYPWLGL